jgi:hypothetical protein
MADADWLKARGRQVAHGANLAWTYVVLFCAGCLLMLGLGSIVLAELRWVVMVADNSPFKADVSVPRMLADGVIRFALIGLPLALVAVGIVMIMIKAMPRLGRTLLGWDERPMSAVRPGPRGEPIGHDWTSLLPAG